MPAEVISLLSSSPPAVSPPVAAVSPAAKSRTTQPAPSRVLDYGVLELPAESSNEAAKRPSDQISNKPITGTKRTSNGFPQQDDDFLFLSDDSDATGTYDGSVTRGNRVSSATGRKKQDNSFKRVKSDVIGSKARESLQPTGLKRWNSVVDPIEHSSSPNGHGPSTSKRQKLVGNVTPDPFERPKNQATSVRPSRVDLSSDPFKSSPERSTDNHRPPVNPKSQQPASNNPLGSPRRCPGNKPPKTSVFIDLSDDILEASPERDQTKKSKQNGAWDPISSSMPERDTRNEVVSLTDSDSDDLPDLGDIDFSKVKSRRRSYSLSLSPVKAKPKAARSTTKKATVEKTATEDREGEKRKRAEAREAERERKRAEKEQAKEQRAIEKQKEKALIEVNKLRTDKKVSAPEMIADLPSSLGVGIKTQIEKLLDNIDVQFQYWDSHVDNVVKWRRKVSSKFNEELGHWEPAPAHIKDEDHSMVIMEARDFVKLVLAAEGQDLEAHISNMKTAFPGNTLIYLIEGLMPWMRKNKNILNRQFVATVRGLGPSANDPGPAAPQPRRRNNNAQQQEYIDEDIIEDALLSLQVVHGALIQHTNVAVETANWVASFTQHISTAPYRRARDTATDAGFCMESGQVRAGDDARDTYIRMLQEVARVTAPIAYGIAARYGTVSELVRGFESEGPGAVEECQKSANKDGAFTERKVGKAVSKRLYKIFMGREPGSLDV
ncbi:hypothetical protein AAE478_006188 [Parahypoxylon ruwenzoriense]